jgi:hypothetical protein
MRKETKAQVKALAAEGWRLVGNATNGHLRLEHESGVRMQIGNTPSCPRGRLNELSRARRKVRAATERA